MKCRGKNVIHKHIKLDLPVGLLTKKYADQIELKVLVSATIANLCYPMSKGDFKITKYL